MREVAKTLGISDVVLAKRCEAVGVPVPPRGYWQKLAADRAPPKPPLPKHRTPETAAAREVGPDIPETVNILKRYPPTPHPRNHSPSANSRSATP